VALLHDIGKPETTTVQEDGGITSHGHAKSGADLAEKILEQLGLPPERCDELFGLFDITSFTIRGSLNLRLT
jgi:HD superfamily phosphodiesterase